MEKIEKNIDMSMLQSFDSVRDRVYGRLMPFSDNKERLRTSPTLRWNNLIIEYRILIGQGEQGIVSAGIDNAMLNRWGIGKAKLISEATENTKKIFPYEARTMKEILEERYNVSLEEMGIGEMEEDEQMIIMSNSQNVDGAICMTDADFSKSVSEKYFGGRNFFILPSSRHEVIAVSKNFKAGEMLNMVSEINKTVLDKSDYLSTSVYEYDAARRKVQCVATETPVEKKTYNR